MAKVNIAELTQEQQWGAAFGLKQYNDEAELNNANAEATSLPVIPLLTLQEYIDSLISASLNKKYADLVSYKEQVALQLFRSASPEKQQQIIEQLQVPDVV